MDFFYFSKMDENEVAETLIVHSISSQHDYTSNDTSDYTSDFWST
jgi:hypothetical protein